VTTLSASVHECSVGRRASGFVQVGFWEITKLPLSETAGTEPLAICDDIAGSLRFTLGPQPRLRMRRFARLFW